MPAFAKRIVSKPEFGPFVLLLAMVIIFWELNPAFLSLRNISNTLAFTVVQTVGGFFPAKGKAVG